MKPIPKEYRLHSKDAQAADEHTKKNEQKRYVYQNPAYPFIPAIMMKYWQKHESKAQSKEGNLHGFDAGYQENDAQAQFKGLNNI